MEVRLDRSLLESYLGCYLPRLAQVAFASLFEIERLTIAFLISLTTETLLSVQLQILLNMNLRTGKSTDLPRVRVGIIGCGQIAQVVHIPTLNFLSDLFSISFLCDVSMGALEYCQRKFPGSLPPKITKSAADLCSSDDVDVVFVLSSDEYHVDQAILALQHDKRVLVEKPVALNIRDVDRIEEAEKASKGRLMVGYMRRYASVFESAVREIGGIDKILYARVRGMSISPLRIYLRDTNNCTRYHRSQQHVCRPVWYVPEDFRGLRRPRRI